MVVKSYPKRRGKMYDYIILPRMIYLFGKSKLNEASFRP